MFLNTSLTYESYETKE